MVKGCSVQAVVQKCVVCFGSLADGSAMRGMFGVPQQEGNEYELQLYWFLFQLPIVRLHVLYTRAF